MRKLFILLLLMSIGLIATDCKKKNYPKDIPKWLQDKIKAIDDDNRKYNKGTFPFFKKTHNCHEIAPRQVDEYFYNSSTYYAIGSSYNGYQVYDYNGVEICYSGNGPPTCVGSYYANLVRHIWVEDCK